jgi:hypothetical protein
VKRRSAGSGSVFRHKIFISPRGRNGFCKRPNYGGIASGVLNSYWARISIARSITPRDREIISETISVKVQPTAEHAKTAEAILSVEGGKKIISFIFFSALSAISAVNYYNFS